MDAASTSTPRPRVRLPDLDDDNGWHAMLQRELTPRSERKVRLSAVVTQAAKITGQPERWGELDGAPHVALVEAAERELRRAEREEGGEEAAARRQRRDAADAAGRTPHHGQPARLAMLLDGLALDGSASAIASPRRRPWGLLRASWGVHAGRREGDDPLYCCLAEGSLPAAETPDLVRAEAEAAERRATRRSEELAAARREIEDAVRAEAEARASLLAAEKAAAEREAAAAAAAAAAEKRRAEAERADFAPVIELRSFPRVRMPPPEVLELQSLPSVWAPVTSGLTPPRFPFMPVSTRLPDLEIPDFVHAAHLQDVLDDLLKLCALARVSAPPLPTPPAPSEDVLAPAQATPDQLAGMAVADWICGEPPPAAPPQATSVEEDAEAEPEGQAEEAEAATAPSDLEIWAATKLEARARGRTARAEAARRRASRGPPSVAEAHAEPEADAPGAEAVHVGAAATRVGAVYRGRVARKRAAALRAAGESPSAAGQCHAARPSSAPLPSTPLPFPPSHPVETCAPSTTPAAPPLPLWTDDRLAIGGIGAATGRSPRRRLHGWRPVQCVGEEGVSRTMGVRPARPTTLDDYLAGVRASMPLAPPPPLLSPPPPPPTPPPLAPPPSAASSRQTTPWSAVPQPALESHVGAILGEEGGGEASCDLSGAGQERRTYLPTTREATPRAAIPQLGPERLPSAGNEDETTPHLSSRLQAEDQTPMSTTAAAGSASAPILPEVHLAPPVRVRSALRTPSRERRSESPERAAMVRAAARFSEDEELPSRTLALPSSAPAAPAAKLCQAPLLASPRVQTALLALWSLLGHAASERLRLLRSHAALEREGQEAAVQEWVATALEMLQTARAQLDPAPPEAAGQEAEVRASQHNAAEERLEEIVRVLQKHGWALPGKHAAHPYVNLAEAARAARALRAGDESSRDASPRRSSSPPPFVRRAPLRPPPLRALAAHRATLHQPA